MKCKKKLLRFIYEYKTAFRINLIVNCIQHTAIGYIGVENIDTN